LQLVARWGFLAAHGERQFVDAHPVFAILLVADTEIEAQLVVLAEQVKGDAGGSFAPCLPVGEPELCELGQPQLLVVAREGHIDVLVVASDAPCQKSILRVTAHERKRRLKRGEFRDQLKLSAGEVLVLRHRPPSIPRRRGSGLRRG
jgi:hypothetical protein